MSSEQPKRKIDPYKVLRVPKRAGENAIKYAFRKRSMETHPDRNPGDEKARNDFEDVKLAYDILSNPDKRKKYDATGEYDERVPDNSLTPIVHVLSEVLDTVASVLVKNKIDPISVNLVAEMETCLNEKIQNLNSMLESSKSEIKLLRRMLKRFKRKKKDGDENILNSMVLGKIAHAELRIERTIERKAQLQKAADFLEDYTFDPEGLFGMRARVVPSNVGLSITFIDG